MKLILSSTVVGLWQKIVHEAEASCTTFLKEEIEAYLVFLLARYLKSPEIFSHVMAKEFLEGLHTRPYQRTAALQAVGDKCLLFSGLFPQIAEKRLVKISYFIQLGQAAYENISKKNNDLYGMLARQFVSLMDILQSIRNTPQTPSMQPLEAYDLWNEADSKRAWATLKQFTSAIPVHINKKSKQ